MAELIFRLSWTRRSSLSWRRQLIFGNITCQVSASWQASLNKKGSNGHQALSEGSLDSLEALEREVEVWQITTSIARRTSPCPSVPSVVSCVLCGLMLSGKIRWSRWSLSSSSTFFVSQTSWLLLGPALLNVLNLQARVARADCADQHAGLTLWGHRLEVVRFCWQVFDKFGEMFETILAEKIFWGQRPWAILHGS